MMNARHSLALAHIGVAVAAFGVASLMGVLQALSIADIELSAAERAAVLHLGDRARRADGAGLHDLLHHGPRLRVRAGEPRPHRRPRARRGSRSGSRAVGHRWRRRSRSCAGRARCSTRSIRRCRRIRSSTSARRCSSSARGSGAASIIASYRVVATRAPRRAGAAGDPRHAGDDHRLVSGHDRAGDRSASAC